MVNILRALTFENLKQAQEQAHEAKLALERSFFDAMADGVTMRIHTHTHTHTQSDSERERERELFKEFKEFLICAVNAS